MRRIFKLFALAAGIAVTVVSCNKDIEVSQIDEPIKLVLRAGSPETRTAITNNGDGTYTPSWNAGDALGVYFTTVAGDAAEFDNEDDGSPAFFEPKEAIGVSGDQTLYAFYPLGAFNAVTSGTSIRVNVKDVQTPNAVGTFDKDADILVAYPYTGNITTISNDGGIIDMRFKRVLSVIKITPAETADAIDGENVKSIKIEYNGSGADAPLTGRVVLDLNSGDLGDWTIKTYSASASFGDGVFALNGSNAAYLLVNPATIAAGKTVTFTVKTDKHDASKSFTLENPMSFPSGNIATIALNIDNTWTIEDNTLDPNIIFKTPFYADISANTSYSVGTHGDLGVVGTSKSTITYAFDGTEQLRNNSNKISDDDGSFYWCTKSTGLVIGGINTGTAQYFTLSFDRKVPSNTATLALTISEDGSHYFPITSDATVEITGTGAATSSFNFSIPAGEHTNLRLKFANSGSGATIDNVTLTKLNEAGANNKAVSFEVVAEDPTLVVVPSPVNLVAGNTQQLSVTGSNGTISYVSNNTSVATVTSSGLITAVAEGSTTIDITSSATAEYNAGATSVTVNVTAVPTPESLPYSNTLINGHSGFTFDIVSAGGLANIWTDSNYGIQANGYQCTSNVEAYAVSPLIDLTAVSGARLTFTHGINYFADVATAQTQATLQVKAGEGDWETVAIPTYPASLGNSTADANVNLSAYVGNVIQLRFKYLATTSNPGRWQIKNLSVEEVAPTYAITINNNIANGSVSADLSEAAEGATVTLTATPSVGYALDAWDVYKTGESSTKVAVSAGAFTMPAYPVTVSASFVAIPTISMNTTSISDVAAAGVSTTASAAYNLLNGANNGNVAITCDGTVVTAASKNETAGSIDYTVANNTGGARDGWIKVKYGDEAPHQITVSQLSGGGGGGTVVFTPTSKSTVSVSGDDTGITATYSNTYNNANQMTGSNSCTLTISGLGGKTITAITINAKNNKSTGSGELTITTGTTDIIDSYTLTGLGSTYTDIPLTVVSGSVASEATVVMSISCTANSTYFGSLSITYE